MQMDGNGKNKVTRSLAMLLAFVLVVSVLTTSLAEHLDIAANSQDALSRIYSMISGSIGEPETSEDYYELSTVAIGQKDYETALKYLETARELADPQDKIALADMWLKTGSVSALLGDFESAMTSLNTALENNPESEQALLLRSQLYLQDMLYNEAAADLQAYMALVPEDIANGSSLAKLYEQLGRYNEARVLYEGFYAMDAEEDSHHLNALRCSFLCGEYEAALESFEAYLTENTEADAQYREIAAFLKAACLMQLERYEEAVAAYEAAITEGYDAVTCYEQMVICSFENDDFETAIAKGEEMIAKELQPVSADIFYQRMGASMMQLGRYEEAIAYLDQAIEANADLLGSHYYRGVSLLALSRCEEAVEDFTKSIEQEFLLQFCYYNRGVCHIQMLNYDKALDDFGMTLTTGDDASLIQAAKDTLWQLAAYYENQAAMVAEPAVAENPDALPTANDVAVDVAK